MWLVAIQASSTPGLLCISPVNMQVCVQVPGGLQSWSGQRAMGRQFGAVHSRGGLTNRVCLTRHTKPSCALGSRRFVQRLTL